MLPTGTTDTTELEFGRSRPFLLSVVRTRTRVFGDQPSLPVLPETLLQLDLLLSQLTLDPEAVAEVLLGDVGAALQVLRVTAGHRTCCEQQEVRVEDCVVQLGRKGLCRALTRVLSAGRDCDNAGTLKIWQRARLCAELARLLARNCPEVVPEAACLAGLLHEVGRLPRMLGWAVEGIDLADPGAVARAIATEWRLPHLVLPVLPTSAGEDRSHVIRAIVTTAWETANAISEIHCSGRRQWTRATVSQFCSMPMSRMQPPQHSFPRSH